jgi:ankyrin repeat protein
MYAAAFSSLDCLRLLVDSKADVNAVTKQGSTALMWSTADVAKVRLLLAHGADVHSRTKDGVTAMLSAAFRGNVEVLRILIAAGADPAAAASFFPGGPPALGLSQIAWSVKDTTLRDFVIQSGLKRPDLNGLSPFRGSLGGPFMTSIFSQRRQTESSMADVLGAILDLGANPNEDVAQLTRVLPPLSRAALLGDVRAMDTLLQHGADPNRRGSEGTTPLMMAAAAERPNAAAIQLLVDHGASIEDRDAFGRTALDWALMQGENEASAVLRKYGATQMWHAPTPPAVSKPRAIGDAVRIALADLQKAGPEFHAKSGCISCHHQSLPAIAVRVARARGVEVDPGSARHPADSNPTAATFAMWAPNREVFLMGNCSIFGFLGNVSYGLLAMAEEGVPPNAITDAAVSCLGSLQLPDGRWEGGDIRPPLAGRSPIVYTALAVRGLKTYAPAGRRDETAAQISRAREFLRTAKSQDTQDESFKLLGLVWSEASPGEIGTQAQRLVSLQGKDGGWAQRSTMFPDAYATGQALYALHAGGFPASASVCRKGARYLLRTQLEDGTWFMRSRAVGFQPYFESGFPHGRDQFISTAATSWAAIALGYAL